MTLVEKFDLIKITPENQIPKADKEWCEKEQANFQVILGQLAERELYFQDQLKIEEQIDKCHYFLDMKSCSFDSTAGKYWKERKDFDTGSYKDGNYYDLFSFSSAYCIEHILKLRKKCKKEFIKNICAYFIKKYKLEIPDFEKERDKKKLESYCDYKAILEAIREHLGGFIDFKGSAVEQAIIEIKEEFKYQTLTIQANIVEFKRFLYGRGHDKYPAATHYRGDYEKFELLDKAISIFETDEVRNNYVILYLSGKYAGEWDAPLNGEKLEAFKFWKSGKFQLKFKEASFATQFVNKFQFKTS